MSSRSPRPSPRSPARQKAMPTRGQSRDGADARASEESVPIPWKALVPLILIRFADAMAYFLIFPMIADYLTYHSLPVSGSEGDFTVTRVSTILAARTAWSGLFLDSRFMGYVSFGSSYEINVNFNGDINGNGRSYTDSATGTDNDTAADTYTSNDIHNDNDKIGLYAGIAEGILMLVEALLAPFWARMADKYGRKRCLLWGLIPVVISMGMLGFGRSKGWIIFWRAAYGTTSSGVLNKIMFTELTSPSNRAFIFSLYSINFTAGSMVGSLVAGGLTRPFGRLPGWLGGDVELWEEWPFPLPCLVCAGFCALSLLCGHIMIEDEIVTHPNHHRDRDRGRDDPHSSRGALEPMISSTSHSGEMGTDLHFDTGADPASDLDSEDHHSCSYRGAEHARKRHKADEEKLDPSRDVIRAVFRIPHYITILKQFCAFQIGQFGFEGFFTVFTYTSIDQGGLGLTVQTIGIITAFSALLSMLSAPMLVPLLQRKLGPRDSLTLTCGVLTIEALFVPFVQFGARHSQVAIGVLVAWMVVLKNIHALAWPLNDTLCATCFDRYPRLLATGSAVTLVAGAFGRAAGPAISGWLFSISTTFQTLSLGRQISWLGLLVLSIPAVLLTRAIPPDFGLRQDLQTSVADVEGIDDEGYDHKHDHEEVNTRS